MVAAMRRFAIALPLAVAGGCYEPAAPAGAPCGVAEPCPTGQTCNLATARCEIGLGGGLPVDAARAIPDAPDAPPGATRVVIGARRDQVRDAEVWLAEPDTATGTIDHISVDDAESALVWFDVSSLPAGADVLGAFLTLTVADEADETGGTVMIYRLRESWDEAAATWNRRTGAATWMTSGARPPSRDGVELAELRPQVVGATYLVEIPAYVVEEWIAAPGDNAGLLLGRGSSTEHIHLRARESGVWTTLTVDLAP